MSDQHYVMNHPKGFRARRGLNWFALGLMYASYYMCRYNFRYATPGMIDEFGFDKTQIADMFAIWSLAYGTGQLINGLLSDKIGGKTSMLIGAGATIIINFIFGFSAFVSTFATFSLIALINGYFQAFGAPGMVKINAAWFHRTERGTFAGIFGGMIQLGQIAINNLAPLIIAGFTIGAYTIGGSNEEWRWVFRIPPLFTAAAAIFMAFSASPSPDNAAYPGAIEDEIDNSEGVTVKLVDSFRTIFTHPLVWFYAIAYACTGAVRHSSDQLAILYFVEQLGLDLENPTKAIYITMTVIPIVAFLGSLGSGMISDKFFVGRRAPVAIALYLFEALVIAISAVILMLGLVNPSTVGVFIGCTILILISLTVNSTHSIVGAAAPMDIGGKKMAGFAAGVIDSFQYYGAAISLIITGRVLEATEEAHGWLAWYVIMAGFGLIGGAAMLLLMLEQRRLTQKRSPSKVPPQLAYWCFVLLAGTSITIGNGEAYTPHLLGVFGFIISIFTLYWHKRKPSIVTPLLTALIFILALITFADTSWDSEHSWSSLMQQFFIDRAGLVMTLAAIAFFASQITLSNHIQQRTGNNKVITG